MLHGSIKLKQKSLSRKESGITRKGGILPYSFPAGFGADTPQQEHFGNSQELKK